MSRADMFAARSTLPSCYRALQTQLSPVRSGPAARPSPNQLVDGRAGIREDNNGPSSYETQSKKEKQNKHGWNSCKFHPLIFTHPLIHNTTKDQPCPCFSCTPNERLRTYLLSFLVSLLITIPPARHQWHLRCRDIDFFWWR